MTYDEFARIAMDQLDSICYMADMDSHELLFLNQAGLEAFGIADMNDVYGAPCYSVLQNLDTPCSFCTNDTLCVGEKIRWQYYNPLVKRHYSLLDTMFLHDNRRIRMELAFDISEHCHAVEDLEMRLKREETLVRCIQLISEDIEIDAAIRELLSHVGTYYGATRSYIFEFDVKEARAFNSYEWCKKPEDSAIAALQNVPFDHLTRWIELFQSHGEVVISSVSTLAEDSEEYKVLTRQGVQSLLAVPLYVEGRLLGFLGVDNPQKSQSDVVLLHSIGRFILDDIRKRRLQEQLEYMNSSDALTGLSNRERYSEKLRELQLSPPPKIGIIYADINGLKHANDLYGHSYGDSLIKRAAHLLREHLGDCVYRVGGDEFIALCTELTPTQFDEATEALRAGVLADEECSLSIGALWKEGHVDVLKEITSSDELMYADKQQYYKSSDFSHHHHRSHAAKELLRALSEDRFEPFLQAKVSLQTGRITGAEALIRKRGENGLYVSPGDFIPGYEFERIIRHLDFFMLESICSLLTRWPEDLPPVPISVNFSRITLLEHNVVEEIIGVADRFHINRALIDIEITESVDQMDNEILLHKMKDLSAAGFPISLDDFGAQYSNLLMLITSDFDQIKLDKSLVEQLGSSDKNQLILSHIIQMLCSLGETTVLAEGIETEAQWTLLHALGCHYGQGYHFHRPLPVAQFLEVYRKEYHASH